MNTYCRTLTDTKVMQMKMENINICPYQYHLSPREFHVHLESLGYKLLLIHTIEFRILLNRCQQCRYYRGEYPEIDKICVKKEEES